MLMRMPKADAKGVRRLHDYLYDDKSDQCELQEIYEEIDEQVDEVEEENYTLNMSKDDFGAEAKELREQVQELVDNFEGYERDEILDALKRILF